MTQRNPMNQRNQNPSHKGSSRKSASSAKPATAAGSSVYTKTQAAKDRESENKRREQDKEEAQRDRERRQALGAGATALPEYKVWRRWWIVCIVIAMLAVALSWILNAVDIPESMTGVSNAVAVISLIVGYAFIAACFIIDWRKIRPIRRSQENLVDSLSKRELKELDDAIEAGKKKNVPTPEAKEKKRGRKQKKQGADGTM